MSQLTIDFTPSPLINGKKLARLSIPCCQELIDQLDFQANHFNTTRAELAFHFIVEGMQKALGTIFMSELHSDKPLKELLRK